MPTWSLRAVRHFTVFNVGFVCRVLALLDQNFQRRCKPNILSVQRTDIVEGEQLGRYLSVSKTPNLNIVIRREQHRAGVRGVEHSARHPRQDGGAQLPVHGAGRAQDRPGLIRGLRVRPQGHVHRQQVLAEL